jgi:hypothetical protein
VVNEERTVVCTACEKPVKAAHETDLPDDGWVLDFDYFGYYSGFTDEFHALIGAEPSRKFTMCHDCVVKLLELFPRLGELVGANNHPCQDAVPCCRHAWQATEFFAKKGFVVRTRTAWPDTVWHDNPPYDAYADLTTEEDEQE